MAAEQSNKLGSHVEMKKVWELLVIIVVTKFIRLFCCHSVSCLD